MMVTAYSIIFFSIARYNRIGIISQLKKSCYNLLGISIFLSLSDVISFFYYIYYLEISQQFKQSWLFSLYS
jgi:hypothetical protein